MDLEILGIRLVVEDHGERVNLRDIEDAAGLEEVGDHLRPARQVGQPGQHAIGGIHDLELPGEHVWKIVDVRVDESGLDLQLAAQRTRHSDTIPGKIDPRHLGTKPGPGERVQPEVALQVQHGSPLYVPQLPSLQRHQRQTSLLEALYVVEGRISVGRHPLIPPGSIHIQVVVHLLSSHTSHSWAGSRLRVVGRSARSSRTRPCGWASTACAHQVGV